MVEVLRRVRHERVDLLVELDVLVHDLVDVEPVGAVDVLEDVVFLLDGARELGAQHVAVQEVDHADARARELVHVGRADAAPGGADGVGVAGLLARGLDGLVVRHDEVRVVRDEEAPLHLVAQLADGADLLHHGHGIDHHAVADHARHVVVEDAARDEVQDERLVVPADRVPGVGAALVAGHDVHLGAEEVHDLAFAFVAPLAADDDRYGHEFG